MSSLSSLIAQEKGMQNLPYDYHSSGKSTSEVTIVKQKESQIVFQHAFSYPIVRLAEIAEAQERCSRNLMEFAGCLKMI